MQGGGSQIINAGNDCVNCLSLLHPETGAVLKTDMNGDGSKQRYVSTFRIHIKPRGSGSAASTTSTSGPVNDTNKTANKGSHSLSPVRRLDPPVFTQPIEDCCVDEGGDITLRGVLIGSQPIRVSWLHNGEVAHFGKPSFNGSEVSFSVRECLPEDAGAYTCLAENSVGKTSCCAAVFVRDFESICGVQNSISDIPAPASKSTMENGGSPRSPKDDLKDLRGSSSPTVTDSHSATGPQRVIPKRRANSGTALHFKNPPQQLKVKTGEPARLTCFFTSSPPVVSCWIRDKEQIVDGPELWTENTDQSSTLCIAEAKPQHTGRYTIAVKDRKSSAQHTLILSVIEKPQPPASCPVVSLVSASSVVLSWSGPCYDGGSAIQGYVVEVRSPGPTEPGDWRELTDQCKSTSYRVCSGLRPQEEYCFRVKAYNAVGVSEPGPESPVVRMEQKVSEKPQEESPEMYTHITIDATHKVTDHYNLLEKLGVGKFGQVFKLTHKETGRVCAGKFYKGRRAKEREAARKEIELMNYLHHPKLVQCLAAYDNKPEMVMVMEFIAGGELFERIVDDNFEHTEPASVRYMQQILEGIAYMHQQNIIHLDLKPENIVCVDHTGTSIKVIDFGLASRLDPNTPLKVMHGTPEFVAPEVISYEPVCLATDMWSIGVICYILLSGESPFQGNSDDETLALVTAAQWEFDEDSFEEITEQAKDFISSLLNKNTRRRMTCEEALAHPWMAAFDSGDPSTTKSLSKEKMKRFLARQKWKKAGKALLALKRMAMLSKGDNPVSPTSPGEDSPLTPEAEHALQSLELKMQGPPQFSQSLEDQTVAQGSRACLSCHLTGYPDPEVVWLCGEEPVVESSGVQIEYDEDGRCTLVLASVGLRDTNTYTCRATNDHGEASCSAKLIVKQ
ncbi:myosin light chain kinase, smooth muscle isoform X2 [Myripristis murdjan]|uniref:myosin light chain kinase, smooth muscle isoform X2 n=1 Tax=Myripristis murdjan TaxID=586833 RepID=UPI001175CA64|nr:myosin light chain kinase, smooth muscle-like isoform X2 [Myripristis murdjan]